MTIVLPGHSFKRPIGGFKVHYEYANQLAERGHDVTVVHTRWPDPKPGREGMKSRAWPAWMRWVERPKLEWFTLDPRVRILLTPDLRARWAPDGDIVIATAWQTAEWVMRWPNEKGRRRVYIVYDYEFWRTAPDAVRDRMAATFRGDFLVVSTSPSVEEMLNEAGATPAAAIACGWDHQLFGVDIDLQHRPCTVGFPVRVEPSKGLADAIQAVQMLHDEFGSELRIRSFGRRERPEVPPFVEQVISPSDAELRAFYNSLAVFMFPSRYEGWGLPGMEALACGAALVTADCVGMRDYAIEGVTARVVAAGDSRELATATAALLRDRSERERLALAGGAHVQRYTWDEAGAALDSLIRSN
ncbi:MAG TPA: glycosyltransferase family 4 protein [Acidimicrobiales bacterium]|nr:glycosyltransferase family 4 protein [Acidimicrobiales bacterium]